MSAHQGEVEISLNGESVVLRSSLNAAKIVNATSQGFAGAFRRLSAFDSDVFVEIIAAGTGKRSSDDIKRIEEAVYRTGLGSLVAPLSKFVNYLMTGGREPSDEVDHGDGEKKD